MLSACCLLMVPHSSPVGHVYLVVFQEQGQCATGAELSGFLRIREVFF